jgi:hypothetical protein
VGSNRALLEKAVNLAKDELTVISFFIYEKERAEGVIEFMSFVFLIHHKDWWIIQRRF